LLGVGVVAGQQGKRFSCVK